MRHNNNIDAALVPQPEPDVWADRVIDLAITHLYESYWRCWDGCNTTKPHECEEIIAHPVTRVTAKRIYFHRIGPTRLDGSPGRRWDDREHFVERARIEVDGRVWHRGTRKFLHLKPPVLPVITPANTAADLRREMAALHPDRGGDPADFRAAHARYVAARSR